MFKSKIGCIVFFAVMLILIMPLSILHVDGNHKDDTASWSRDPKICDPELYTAPFFDVYLLKDDTVTPPIGGDSCSYVDAEDINKDGLLDFVVGYSIMYDVNKTHLACIDIYWATGEKNYRIERIRGYKWVYGEWEVGKKYVNQVYGIALADFDVDGDIDIMVTLDMFLEVSNNPHESIRKPEIRIIRNDNGKFVNETTIVEFDERIDYWINPHIAVADFDMDGDPDFVVGSNNGKVALYKNNGNGTFAFSHVIYDYGTASWGLATGDFNGDGYPDLVVCAETDPDDNNTNFTDAGHIYLKLNDKTNQCFNTSSPGILVSHLPPPAYMGKVLGGSAFGAVEVLDYNKDGLMDVVFGGDWRLFLFIQQENGTFKPFLTFMVRDRNLTWTDRFYGGNLAVADFDHDGYDDILAGGLEGRVLLLINNKTYVCINEPGDREIYFFGKIIFGFPLPGQKMVIGPINVTVEKLVPLSRVDFYLDGKLVHTDTSEPFEWRWIKPGLGKYTLYVEGFDESGEFAGRDTITVWKIL